jgi:hypothetical protein
MPVVRPPLTGIRNRSNAWNRELFRVILKIIRGIGAVNADYSSDPSVEQGGLQAPRAILYYFAGFGFGMNAILRVDDNNT